MLAEVGPHRRGTQVWGAPVPAAPRPLSWTRPSSGGAWRASIVWVPASGVAVVTAEEERPILRILWGGGAKAEVRGEQIARVKAVTSVGVQWCGQEEAPDIGRVRKTMWAL